MSQLLEQVYGEGLGDGRRVARRERKTHDLKRLHEGHHEVLNMRLLGYNEREISQKTGYTPEAISLILGSTLAQAKLRQMRLARDGEVLDVARKIHEELVPKAIAVYERILDAEEAEVGMNLKKSTADVVTKDLAGLAAPKELRINGHMTHEALTRITQRGIVAAKECGLLSPKPVEDAEIVDE